MLNAIQRAVSGRKKPCGVQGKIKVFKVRQNDRDFYFSVRGENNKVLVAPVAFKHGIRGHGMEYNHRTTWTPFEDLLSILKTGFTSRFPAYNVEPHVGGKNRLSGYSQPSPSGITKGDGYTIEFIHHTTPYAGGGVAKVIPSEIASVSIVLNPASTKEEQLEKKKFYSEKLKKFKIPIKYIASPQE